MPTIYDTTFGTLLVATWVNMMLYALEISQVRVYFKHHSAKDPLLVRTMVKICLLFDSFCIVAECACVYLYAVTHWGDADYLQKQDWPIPMYIMATGVSTLVVQMFLIRRYFHLVRESEGPWKPMCMVILSLACFGGAYASAVMIILQSTYSSRGQIVVPVTLWLALSAATDWSIALSLIWKLRQMRSGFKSSAGTVQRIIYMTIQTGTATSILALTALFLYLASKTTNLATMFGFCIGTTYSLTMLHNLNKRHDLAGKTPGTPSCPGETGSLGVGFTALTPGLVDRTGANSATRTSISTAQRGHHPALPPMVFTSDTETSTLAKLEQDFSPELSSGRPSIHRISAVSMESSIVFRRESEEVDERVRQQQQPLPQRP
ncbi:hypothetical protein BDV98DRAFT_601993 [Pterulicium gracile]|uniref:DUF6534 domain-containing protein n=1 Tax=Pterulicium gracile TaxID=1884261 RepID=A0A5C3QRD9_9AGAR|nr:hypothetical protein BDV98DRAFT_601993 [Pterula gracilis]